MKIRAEFKKGLEIKKKTAKIAPFQNVDKISNTVTNLL